MSSRRRARPGSAPIRSSGGSGSGSGSGRGGARQPRAARPASASSSGGSRGYAAPTLASMHKENDVPNVVGSCDMVRGPGAQGRLPLRPRPRPGRPGSRTIPLKPGERHPLGGWVGQSKHASGQELWHSRWKGLQPDVSFDVDGDGVVSSEDLLVAREFDKDGNGMLDGEERRELRRALAKTGIETYYALPKGPPLRKAQTKSSLLFPTPREAAPTDGIDPDSDAWHFRMDTLHQKTRTLQKYSSERMRGLIAHAHTDAKPVNMIRDLMDAKQGMKAQGNARISSNARTPRSARSPRARAQDKMREIFDSIDEDNSGYLDRQELGHLAKRAGRHLNERQLDDAMRAMDADNSGQVDFEEFCDWWENGKIEPPQGSEVFSRITDQVERKVSNVRTLFRKFDENCKSPPLNPRGPRFDSLNGVFFFCEQVMAR